MTDTYIKLLSPIYPERVGFTVTAYFRNGSAAEAPTTIHYRIDDLTGGNDVTGWTSFTPVSSEVNITIKSSENRIFGQANKTERRQLVVAADKGTDNETRDVVQWFIQNIRGFDE